MGHADIDRKSFELGVITAFAEVVSLGVKKLALSSPLAPDEYDELNEAAEHIVEKYGISSWLEKDFLVTDLFAEDIARDRYVLFLYADDGVLEEYLALKRRKKELEDSGGYDATARREIAFAFGRLLSYPDGKISEMLS
jgi:hypothetical protein